MEEDVGRIREELFDRFPALESCRVDVDAAFGLLRDCLAGGGKVLACGNGGSAADAEHIVGELMKGFRKRRPLGEDAMRRFAESCPGDAEYLGAHLQAALPAVSLAGQPALATAFANDVAPDLVFAQQVLGFGRPGDVLLALSTSGGSRNVVLAAETARAFGMRTVAMTGQGGGRLAEVCDAAIRVPERETYRVQELHLPVYHALCAMLEEAFF